MSIDLENYIRQYSGRMKIERLVHISEVSPSLAVEAAKLAISELKKGRNTTLYRELSAKFQQKGLPITVDEEWAVRVDEESRKQLEKLEMELSQSKTNLIKESIRLGYNELGAFYYDRGDLPSALNSYVRTRDYCTTPKQLLEMCLNVVRVAIELRKFNQIMPYVEKGRQHVDAVKDKRDSGKLKVANGLVLLDGQKYRHAARFFVETPTELGDTFSEIMAANDVAIYGALCALATFDRSEIKQKLIDNPDFKNYLELVPEIREIIQDFYDSRYTTCLAALDKMRDMLVLDLFLHHHVEALYQQIRQRALRQYVSPFMSVDLNRMAKAFNTTTPLLEKELAQLIMMENGIQARIDSHNKVLYARRDNQRVVTFEKVLQTGKDFVAETEANVRRLNMMKHDFHVRAPKVDLPAHLLSATPLNLSAR